MHIFISDRLFALPSTSKRLKYQTLIPKFKENKDKKNIPNFALHIGMWTINIREFVFLYLN